MHKAITALCGSLANHTPCHNRIVRIGLYENRPKIFTGLQGNPCGIFVDIIKEVSRKENWSIQYIPGTWAECLQRLDNNAIDIMPDVAFSQERALRYDFNQIPVFTDWLEIYRSASVKIDTVAELDGKTVAILSQSVQEQALQKMTASLGINYHLLSLPDYVCTLRAVEEAKADAVVVSRFFSSAHYRPANVQATGIILRPAGVYFAVTKGRNQELLATSDRHIVSMKNDIDIENPDCGR